MSDVMNPDGTHKVIYDKDAPIPFYQYRIAKLEAEVTELREAIKTHKDSFIGDEGDICTEDDRLWAALEVEK